MNSQRSPSTDAASNPEPNKEAVTSMSPQSEAKKGDPGKTFAHDINAKIDQLEEHIASLGTQYKSSEGKLRLAIGDISSRTAVVTDEIARFSDQMLKSDIENKDLVSALDSRLKGALNKLKGELGGLDSQISSHHSTIQSLKADLDVSHSLLDSRIIKLEEDIQAKLADISTEQGKQHHTQQVFAEQLTDLEKKGSLTADELYASRIESAEQQRLNNKKFIVGTSAMVALILITLGVISYFHWGATDFGPETVNQQIDNRMNEFEGSLAGNFASKTEVQAQTANIDSMVNGLQQKLSETSAQLSLKDQAAEDSLQDLSEKIAALQLSVYGPEDSAANNVTPEVPVKDNEWIAQQNPEHYSIQLVGVYRERSLFSFVNRHADDLTDHPVAFNVSEYRGQDWYNLIYGNFASFSEAQDALESLPASIQRNDPWVRQMGSVQRTGRK